MLCFYHKHTKYKKQGTLEMRGKDVRQLKTTSKRNKLGRNSMGGTDANSGTIIGESIDFGEQELERWLS